MINCCNTTYNQIDKYYWLIVEMLCSAYMKTSCLLRGVTLGKRTRFLGLAKIKRGNANSIVIGKECTFRSMTTSNLIGINRPCILSSLGVNGSSLTIGEGCGFSGTVVASFLKVTIGDSVRCGANTLITDSDWHLRDGRVANPQAVTIHDNVFLGANATVLKGVTIGENTIVGAGSVVTRDLPANVVAAGNPCKVIRPLSSS